MLHPAADRGVRRVLTRDAFHTPRRTCLDHSLAASPRSLPPCRFYDFGALLRVRAGGPSRAVAGVRGLRPSWASFPFKALPVADRETLPVRDADRRRTVCRGSGPHRLTLRWVGKVGSEEPALMVAMGRRSGHRAHLRVERAVIDSGPPRVPATRGPTDERSGEVPEPDWNPSLGSSAAASRCRTLRETFRS